MSRDFVKSNVLVLIIANSANIFAYLFQFVMGRYLSVEDFGVLNSVNSLATLIGSLIGIVPYIVAKYIIKFKDNKELSSLFLYKTFKFTIFLSLVISILIYLFISDIVNYLNLKDSIPIYIFLLSTITSIIVSIFYGIMQGLLMYVRSSIKSSSHAILKFIFAYVLVVFIGYNYNGALFANVLANIFVGIWVFTVVNKHIKFKNSKNIALPKGTYLNILKYAIPLTFSWFLIAILTNIDLILVKHYLNETEAGEYSVTAIIARIAIFLPSVLLAVLFPQVLQNSKDGKSSISTIIIVMILTLILSGGFTFVVALFPELVITILFGEKYINGAEVLVVITFAMALVAVLNVLYNFFLAKHIYSFIYCSYAILIVTLLSITFYMHNSSLDIAKAILIGSISLVVTNSLLLIYYYFKEKKPKRI